MLYLFLVQLPVLFAVQVKVGKNFSPANFYTSKILKVRRVDTIEIGA